MNKPNQRYMNLAKALFQKFRVIFPQKWDLQYKTEEIAAANIAEWALMLETLTNEQMANGVEKTRLECEWPPSIAEFKKLCVGDEEHWQHKAMRLNRCLSLPRAKPNKEKARMEINKMRQSLGISI